MRLWAPLTAVVVSVFAVAASAQTVVRPTGDPQHDLAAVQGAVDAGGTVLLKARDARGRPRSFNFGEFPAGWINWSDPGADPSGFVALGIGGDVVRVEDPSGTFYVSLDSDVRLVGEVSGGAITTIEGGTIPIRNFSRREIPGVGVQSVVSLSNLSIERIRFLGSALQSVYFNQLVGVPGVAELLAVRHQHPRIVIRHSEFVDVKPALSFRSVGGHLVPTYWYSLAAVTDGAQGTVRLEDNHVTFAAGRWAAEQRAFEQQNGFAEAQEFWEGFSIADLQERADIAGNIVQGVDVGLLVYFGGSGVVHIQDNGVKLRPEGLVGISCQANHRYVVERNTVIAPGANPDGIILWATDATLGLNDSTIRHNRVVLDGSEYGGISLIGAGARNVFRDNIVEGSAAFSFGLVADSYAPDAIAEENSFAGNSISHFTPRDSAYYGAGVHVFFDTHTRRNTFRGNSGIVRDLGEGNIFTSGPEHR
jgi:hypothetical protein